jgi:hypothetical protein
MKYKNDDLAAKPNLFGGTLERTMFFKKHFYSIPFRYTFLTAYLYIRTGIWKDGYVGRKWIECRIEYYKMIEKKYQEIKRTRNIPTKIKPRIEYKFSQIISETDLQKSFLKNQSTPLHNS